MKTINKNTFKAESWEDLQKELFSTYDKKLDRFRSNFAYRGVSDASYGLETSLQRIGRKPSETEIFLIRNFKKYSPINTLVDDYNNVWNWISLAQHHGLPTRLLDWTFSPYVALHFMTDDVSAFEKDGAIWIIDFVQIKNYLPIHLKEKLEEQKTLSFTSNELKSYIGNSIPEIDNYHKKNGDALLFFEAPSIDDRIINQFALFSTMLNPDSNILVWLQNNPNLYKKIVVPSFLKWEIRDKLDQSNITERIIYPGLDGIAKWLSRWYREKDNLKKWTL